MGKHEEATQPIELELIAIHDLAVHPDALLLLGGAAVLSAIEAASE